MTDRELLESAAKAAGVELKYDTFGQSENADRVYCYWNPLIDDGDALRLASHLGFSLVFDCYPSTLRFRGLPFRIRIWSGGWVKEDFDSTNRDEIVRRTITRAAAELGKAIR